MEFISSLTTKQIKSRLESTTQPLEFPNTFERNVFLSKCNQDNSFYLVKTGGFFTIKPIHPFVGEIEEKENQTIISGNFGLTKLNKIIYGCFFGFPWVVFLSNCLFDNYLDFFGFLLLFSCLTVWTLFGYFSVVYVPNIFHRKMNQSVINFIEENLLK